MSNMNYALAKELKENGFPQIDPQNDGEGNLIFTGVWLKDPERKSGVLVYCPTLSELIEACGSTFQCLWSRADMNDGWIAKAWEGSQMLNYEEAIGSTPEEAVARLWLALNKT